VISKFPNTYVQAATLGKVEFCFCPRNENIVGHSLVKECVYQQNVWFDEPPSFIIPLLVDDVSVL
jgi:hypothetical protein